MGVRVDPCCARSPAKRAPAERIIHRKNRGLLRIGSGVYCKTQYSQTVGSPKHGKIRYIHSRYIAGQVSWLEGLPASFREPPAGCQPSASRLWPATIQCRIVIPGRCRGWRGCQTPAAGHQLAGSQPQATAGRIIIPGWCCSWWGPMQPAKQARLVLLAGTGRYYRLVLFAATGWCYWLVLLVGTGWYDWLV